MQLNIRDVFAGTQNQINVGIYGTVVLEIVGNDNMPIMTVSNITIRKNKNGEMFLSMPSIKSGEKYYNIVDLFRLSDNEATNTTQKAARAELTKEILRLLDAGGTKKPAKEAPVATSASSSKQGKFPWEKK